MIAHYPLIWWRPFRECCFEGRVISIEWCLSALDSISNSILTPWKKAKFHRLTHFLKRKIGFQYFLLKMSIPQFATGVGRAENIKFQFLGYAISKLCFCHLLGMCVWLWPSFLDYETGAIKVPTTGVIEGIKQNHARKVFKTSLDT